MTDRETENAETENLTGTETVLLRSVGNREKTSGNGYSETVMDWSEAKEMQGAKVAQPHERLYHVC